MINLYRTCSLHWSNVSKLHFDIHNVSANVKAVFLRYKHQGKTHILHELHPSNLLKQTHAPTMILCYKAYRKQLVNHEDWESEREKETACSLQGSLSAHYRAKTHTNTHKLARRHAHGQAWETRHEHNPQHIMPLTKPGSQDGWNEDDFSDTVWHETSRRRNRRELNRIDWAKLS